MKSLAAEAKYPLNFRDKDAVLLADNLLHRNVLELVGMKRVGINNFLRFFIFQRHIEKKYLKDGKKICILVDLNDLIEHDLFAFWRLTLKRIVDSTENYVEDKIIISKISAIFLRCIQSGDFFLTYDGVRESLLILTKANFLPTIFFTRFDRLNDIASVEFFDNLKSIRDATGQKLTYVFTSFRELSQMFPVTVKNELISRFLTTVYIRPLTKTDQKIVLEHLLQKYELSASPQIQSAILFLSGGHTQYIHLCVIIAHELSKTGEEVTEEKLIKEVKNDERINLLSEEIWESLTDTEKDVLKKTLENITISDPEKESSEYLWHTGIIIGRGKENHIFNPLLTDFITKIDKEKENNALDLSKKENALFQLLKENLHDVCERDSIAKIVWPESKEYGVSDWSIDRLIARVRSKLKRQKSEYEIITIRTRGYKLVVSNKSD